MNCCYIDNFYFIVQKFKILVLDNSYFLNKSKRACNAEEERALVLWVTIQNK